MELFEWLQENKCDLSKVTERFRLNPKSVIEAAEVVFCSVKQGEIVKPIAVAWRIRAVAMAINSGRNIAEFNAYKEARAKEEKALLEQKKKLEEEWAEIRASKKKSVPLWLKIITLWWRR